MTHAVVFAAFAALGATPLVNGDFERGLEGWGTQNAWYERPQGAGLSAVLVAEREGQGNSRALKIVGEGKRNLAMQVLPVYPGRYRVNGWIKCEKLDAGQAGVLLEWMSRKDKWMRGDWAVQISGSRDWQRFEATVEAPPGARSVHFDLIATEPNHGTVWFDDLHFDRLASDFPEPQAPKVSTSSLPGQEGCLEVTWDPKQLAVGTCRLLVFCEPAPRRDGTTGGIAAPKATPDSEDGRVTLGALDAGREYRVFAVAVNADGKRSVPGPAVVATPADRQAPRPGWTAAQAASSGRVLVSWTPHVLDRDIAKVHLGVAGGRKGEFRELATIDAEKLYSTPRPFYCTAPWATVDVQVPRDSTKIGVWCEDRTGNRGDVVWADVQPAYPSDRPGACALWLVPPTDQIRRDAPPPATRATSFDLTLLRGQAKGFQIVVRPEMLLRRARVSFSPLLHDDGQSRIDSRWLAYHFVDYVRIEKNSRATPKEELVWPGPADYPDRLSDDLVRDLPGGQIQPIYVRVSAPRDAKPGLYRGQGFLETDQGRTRFTFAVQIRPLGLPERPQLKFVYWFSWDAPCKEFGVEPKSADGWRVLGRLGELMRAHHQNVVVVPWDLVATWRKDDGTLLNDFREFDRFVETFQAAGVDRLFTLSHVGSRSTGEWECPTMVSSRHRVRRLDNGEPQEIDAVELLPALQQHLEAKGWLNRFAIHVADEPIARNVESYKQLASRVHQAAPKLRRIDAIHVPNLRGSLEIWVPQLNYFEQWLDPYRAAQRAGSELWFYIAWVPQGRYPNRMIDSQAIKSRVLHWLNATYDTTGYLHWALNHWQIPLTSLGSPGDQYITWPSRRYIANGSLRYEAEREGLEDCELMFMLRDALAKTGLDRAEAQKRMVSIAGKAVRNIQDYTRSWRELEAVRLELLQRTEAALTEAGHR